MRVREDILEKLRDCIVKLDSEGVKRITEEALDIGIAPAQIISNGISKGSEIVGRKLETGEYFLWS